MINKMLKITTLLAIVALWACEAPRPSMSGRLSGPTDLEVVKSCPQEVPDCKESDKRHLLLIPNSLENSVRIFDVQARSFFKAPNPLFPFSIQVGQHPRNMVVDPLGRFAFVVNGISEDVSVIDLAPNSLIEVDTDWNSCSSFCGPCRDEEGKPINTDGPQDDRCQAGVSRVALSPEEGCQPEDIVTIKDARLPDPADSTKTVPWLSELPLPAYVSLPGSGQVAVLEFLYPGQWNMNYAQHMETVMLYDVGGQPSGLEITNDGGLVFVADEASDSIVVIDTYQKTFSRVNIGGTSRRLALTPDESVLYVVRTDDSLISLVDVATLTKINPGVAGPNSTNPEGLSEDLGLPGIPRSITFVSGMTTLVYDESNASQRDHTTEMLSIKELADINEVDSVWVEPKIETFAYVSNLNGQVHVIDAVNHRAVDLEPFVGAAVSGQPELRIAGEVILDANWVSVCEELDKCPYPQLVGFGEYYEAPRVVEDEVSLLASCSGNGKVELAQPGEDPEVLVPICVCDPGYHAVGRDCVAEGIEEIWRDYYGIHIRSGISRTESWIMTYEGILPGTEQSSSGRLFSFRLEDDRPGIDFVEAGVQVGDYLQVLSAPSVISREGDDPCRKGSGADERDYDSTDFTILTVGTNFLELEPAAGLDPSLCWPEAVRYRVRVKQAWTVWGSASGIQPRLTMIPYTEEPPADPVYNNGQIALTMFEPGAAEEDILLERDDSWTFITNDGFIATKFAPTVSAGAAGALIALDTDEDDDSATIMDDRVYVIFEGSNALLEFFPAALDASNFLLFQ
ncbi:MAG: hypothetical protein JRJ87_14660 [Deltaproteobacteria bacterium]|nr:hypothetical protein [Deltaproteobacteria bacterium]